MNAKTSILINAVLFVAVAVLYYLHFSCAPSTCAAGENDSTSISKPIVMSPKEIKASKIVYVNSDILNKDYDFVKDLTSAAMAKQQRLQGAYETKAQKFQADYAELQQKASQGLLSENQSNAAQADLVKRKEELDKMEMQLQSMMDEVQKSNEEVRQTVVNYVKEYNKNGQYNYILTYTDGPGGVVLLANDSLDITKEILDGLNAQYKATKDSSKKK
ncbi:MAG: OmpH family outer membrane protein [Bacteroidota bacterium]